MDKNEIKAIIKKKNVKFIRLQFTDIFGTLKNVAVTANQIEKALNNKCMFDGSSIEGFVRIEESDMYLHPDLDTFTIFPWCGDENKTARLICDVYKTNGQPFEGDPRYILRRAVKEAADMGFTFNVGPECEFFLFDTNELTGVTNRPTDNAGYFDLGPVDKGEDARRDICLNLEQMGFNIEAAHHECARGQHEIDFEYSNALTAADNIMTFKLAVKCIANNHGLYASFMPKPIFNEAGSGMHINMSLFKKGKNIFENKNDKLGLSNDAYSFIAGLLEHARGMTAITNPLVNSYKRLVAGYEAPVYITWSVFNRSPLVRIPSAKGAETRIELRHPDPSANPYLTLAVSLMAGLDGIKRNLTPPAAIDGNVYLMNEKDLEENKIQRLPKDLDEAIAELGKDKVMIEALGNHVFNKFTEAKLSEWVDYSNQVHQWELDKYLPIY